MGSKCSTQSFPAKSCDKYILDHCTGPRGEPHDFYILRKCSKCCKFHTTSSQVTSEVSKCISIAKTNTRTCSELINVKIERPQNMKELKITRLLCYKNGHHASDRLLGYLHIDFDVLCQLCWSGWWPGWDRSSDLLSRYNCCG